MDDALLLALALSNKGGGGGGTSNYNELSNKPRINGHDLIGNKTAENLGLLGEDDVVPLDSEQMSSLLSLI